MGILGKSFGSSRTYSGFDCDYLGKLDGGETTQTAAVHRSQSGVAIASAGKLVKEKKS